MRVIRKIGFFGLLAAATLFAQDAAATLTSSHYDGSTYYYTPGGLHGRIDFAVYDDRDEYFTVNGLQAPGTGDYVYAYQIFHDSVVNPALSYFAILGIEGVPVDGIDSHDDQSDGIASTDEYFTASRGVWEFQNEHGQGILSAGEHSWFLVLSSETDWVVGEYEIRAAGDLPVPIPEPVMITLLGIGGVLTICARRKKSA
ncbi:hypothetical protein ES703_91284 [subsurface metagenome]